MLRTVLFSSRRIKSPCGPPSGCFCASPSGARTHDRFLGPPHILPKLTFLSATVELLAKVWSNAILLASARISLGACNSWLVVTLLVMPPCHRHFHRLSFDDMTLHAAEDVLVAVSPLRMSFLSLRMSPFGFVVSTCNAMSITWSQALQMTRDFAGVMTELSISANQPCSSGLGAGAWLLLLCQPQHTLVDENSTPP